MTREEKQKAIDALKISVPIKALTQEEFKDYIQTLNKIMDWLEQETVSKESYDHEYFIRKELEIKIAKLKQQEPVLDKIFSIVHPLSIMSTPELEHKAIMQIAEMLEPLCMAESEEV